MSKDIIDNSRVIVYINVDKYTEKSSLSVSKWINQINFREYTERRAGG